MLWSDPRCSRVITYHLQKLFNVIVRMMLSNDDRIAHPEIEPQGFSTSIPNVQVPLQDPRRARGNSVTYLADVVIV